MTTTPERLKPSPTDRLSERDLDTLLIWRMQREYPEAAISYATARRIQGPLMDWLAWHGFAVDAEPFAGDWAATIRRQPAAGEAAERTPLLALNTAPTFPEAFQRSVRELAVLLLSVPERRPVAGWETGPVWPQVPQTWEVYARTTLAQFAPPPGTPYLLVPADAARQVNARTHRLAELRQETLLRYAQAQVSEKHVQAAGRALPVPTERPVFEDESAYTLLKLAGHGKLKTRHVPDANWDWWADVNGQRAPYLPPALAPLIPSGTGVFLGRPWPADLSPEGLKTALEQVTRG